VLDQAGDRVTQGGFEIKLDLGVAPFHHLRLERDGYYRLRASTHGLPSVESVELEVEDD
jgi:hypothetical protein